MQFQVNIGKALFLALGLVLAVIAGKLDVVDDEMVSNLFILAFGYVVGNGVGARNGNPSAPLLQKVPGEPDIADEIV